jgi:predicted RNA binding protein YcfA (HicA-like mRNA interferase family)
VAGGGFLLIAAPGGHRRPHEPDDQRFVLPVRHDTESVQTFLTRIVLAAERAAE